VRLSSSKRDVKSYGFSYESCQQQTAPSSLCPSEGYESGSDSGVHLNTVSPKSSKISSSRRYSSRQAQQQQVQGQRQRPHLMPIGEMGRKNFSSSGTSTSGSGGSAGHYESSGYESVMRDSECSSLDSSQESDRGADGLLTLPPHQTVQAIISGPSHKSPAAIGNFYYISVFSRINFVKLNYILLFNFFFLVARFSQGNRAAAQFCKEEGRKEKRIKAAEERIIRSSLK